MLADGQDVVLLTMNEQWLCTLGCMMLSSLWHGGHELGPVDMCVVRTLLLGVDVVIRLPLFLRHRCWIGQECKWMTIQ